MRRAARPGPRRACGVCAALAAERDDATSRGDTTLAEACAAEIANHASSTPHRAPQREVARAV